MAIEWYVWPDEDSSFYKIIHKPAGKMWGAFDVIGSKIHPMGDFDNGIVPNLNEPHRVYQTRKGYRVFYTGRYNPPFLPTLHEMWDQGADKSYLKNAKYRKYYAARVSPKYTDDLVNNPGSSYSIVKLVYDTGEAHPGWTDFIAAHDELTNATGQSELIV